MPTPIDCIPKHPSEIADETLKEYFQIIAEQKEARITLPDDDEPIKLTMRLPEEYWQAESSSEEGKIRDYYLKIAVNMLKENNSAFVMPVKDITFHFAEKFKERPDLDNLYQSLRKTAKENLLKHLKEKRW